MTKTASPSRSSSQPAEAGVESSQADVATEAAKGQAEAQLDASEQATAPATAVVDGFRSARFGMDEKAVRAAILSDFEIKDDAIQSGEHSVERTKILTVSVPDLIRHGGVAQVSYVFGYLTKKLIQVGVTWSDKTDPTMTATMLYENGELLRNHFMSEAYAQPSIQTNVVIGSGIMMFRGVDAQGHVTLLLLQGAFSTGQDGGNTLTPASLDLLYSAAPNEPDIFKLPKGSF
ncbi:hypothetical protein [Thioclava indica]|uniref:Uncharacterized protein n=1 Tax=Thioclava indica TaxID=1353528 RepID=A0A074JVX4_9RHOB|nr:hypothetical protein [Thioclava indica]KEO60050.1 hypothetical protein DT23_14720 [Thioclava indica]